MIYIFEAIERNVMRHHIVTLLAFAGLSANSRATHVIYNGIRASLCWAIYVYTLFVSTALVVPAQGRTVLEGQIVYNMWTPGGQPSATVPYHVRAEYDNIGYQVTLSLTNGAVYIVSYDGTNGYSLMFPESNSLKALAKNPSFALPAHLGTNYYPFDGYLPQKIMVSAIESITRSSPTAGRFYNPFVDQRTSPMDHALIRTGELLFDRDSVIEYRLDKQSLQRQMKDVMAAPEIFTWTKKSDVLKQIGAGMLNMPDEYMHSTIRLSRTNDMILLKGTRFYNIPNLATQAIETVTALLTSNSILAAGSYIPDAKGFFLSLADHRLVDRAHGVDSIEYTITNQDWLSMPQEVLIRKYELLRKQGPRRLTDALTLKQKVMYGAFLLLFITTVRL